MATTPRGSAAPRVIFVGVRKSWREAYGDLPGLIDAARDEAANGRLENAWACYEHALTSWMWVQWGEHSGKPNTPHRETSILLQKLRSSGLIDRWTLQAIQAVLLQRPREISWRHLDVVASLVTTMTLENGNRRGGIVCRA